MTESAIGELDKWFPPRGACGICGHPDARHRLWDAIMGSAGDSDETTARWYDHPVEAIQAVKRIRPYAREDNRMKLFTWVKRVERWIVPQAVWGWYYDLPKWPRNLVNWFGVHGGITALVVLLFALPGMLGLGDKAIGAWVGYGLGAGFYVTKEVVTWRMGGSKWPSLDQVGDAVGPVIVGLIAVGIFS